MVKCSSRKETNELVRGDALLRNNEHQTGISLASTQASFNVLENVSPGFIVLRVYVFAQVQSLFHLTTPDVGNLHGAHAPSETQTIPFFLTSSAMVSTAFFIFSCIALLISTFAERLAENIKIVITETMIIENIVIETRSSISVNH